jgi:hypothetical protein
MDQAWISAARTYGTLGVSERAVYWNNLGPDQQRMLRLALEEINSSIPEATPNLPLMRGCWRTTAVGCCGVVLGVVLTVALELLAIAAGVQMVAGALSPSSAPVSTESPWDRFMSNPFWSDPDPMPDFCKDGMIAADAYEQIACRQWAERHSPGGSWGP